MTEQLKKFKVTWQERRVINDHYGDEIDSYLENLHEIVEAVDEDGACEIWAKNHAESAVTGACDDCVEAIEDQEKFYETLLNFGDALVHLKAGNKIARIGWVGFSGMWIALGGTPTTLEADKFWNKHSKAHAIANGGSAVVEPYIIAKTLQESIQMGWSPSQDDVLAEDWLVIDRPKQQSN